MNNEVNKRPSGGMGLMTARPYQPPSGPRPASERASPTSSPLQSRGPTDALTLMDDQLPIPPSAVRLLSPERSPTPERSPEPQPRPQAGARKRLRECLDDAKALAEQMGGVFETIELQATEIESLKKRLRAAIVRGQQTHLENVALLQQNSALTGQLAEARSALPQPQAVDDAAIPTPAATRTELEGSLARLQHAAGLLAD